MRARAQGGVQSGLSLLPEAWQCWLLEAASWSLGSSGQLGRFWRVPKLRSDSLYPPPHNRCFNLIQAPKWPIIWEEHIWNFQPGFMRGQGENRFRIEVWSAACARRFRADVAHGTLWLGVEREVSQN